MKLPPWIAILLLCPVPLVGMAFDSPQALSQQHEMAMPGHGQTADQDMMAGMERMNHEMLTARMSGNPDHDFVAMMIPHHQGAVAMAQVELRYGKDPEMRRLATGIIAAQEKEIALMQRWLAIHSDR